MMKHKLFSALHIVFCLGKVYHNFGKGMTMQIAVYQGEKSLVELVDRLYQFRGAATPEQ